MRAAPGLDADIADTVSSGAILLVVGKNGSWLKINKVGYEVWLADWVNYSRLESSAPTGSLQPTAPIDNCCFVNRQCQSDQEWIDGYWAYQNNYCPVSAASAQQTPAEVPTNPASEVDNCCFVDRQCQSDQDWINGYWAYQTGQCAASAQSVSSVPLIEGNCCELGWRCRFEEETAQGYWAFQINQCVGLPRTSAIALTGPVPRIEGSSRFVQHIIGTLKWMKSVAPDWYNYVISGMDVVVEAPVHVEPWNDGQRTTCTARAYPGERKASLETCFMLWTIRGGGIAEFDQVHTAAALGHEACHIHSYDQGKHFASLEQEEAECRKFGTGASVLLDSALSTGLSPRRGTHYFGQENAVRLIRRYCSEGYRSDLFCPTLQRLEGIWRNVPYAVFPPGAPEW